MTQRSVTVIRHVRDVSHRFFGVAPKGGYVLAFEIVYDQEVRVGIAKCRDDENFNKRLGNSQALKALANNPIVILWADFDEEESLVENFNIIAQYGDFDDNFIIRSYKEQFLYGQDW